MAFKNQGFEVILASPPEYEALTAEIFFDGKFVALVSQERGLDQLQFEIPGTGLDEDKIARKVDLKGFLQTVEIACKRLRGEIK
jgi:hypothetical protein